MTFTKTVVMPKVVIISVCTFLSMYHIWFIRHKNRKVRKYKSLKI